MRRVFNGAKSKLLSKWRANCCQYVRTILYESQGIINFVCQCMCRRTCEKYYNLMYAYQFHGVINHSKGLFSYTPCRIHDVRKAWRVTAKLSHTHSYCFPFPLETNMTHQMYSLEGMNIHERNFRTSFRPVIYLNVARSYSW